MKQCWLPPLLSTRKPRPRWSAVEDWGKRRLAYPINKENEGVYTLINFTSEADFPAELDRVYKITDGVLRSMIVAKEEAVPAKAETEAK